MGRGFVPTTQTQRSLSLMTEVRRAYITRAVECGLAAAVCGAGMEEFLVAG